MSQEYFSDRENGTRPRTIDKISQTVWNGIQGIVYRKQNDGSFGHAFPRYCKDGPESCGCDMDLFEAALKSEIPEIVLPLGETPPPDLVILDLIEFCYKYTAKPRQGDFHKTPELVKMAIYPIFRNYGFEGHFHYTYDIVIGQDEFRSSINLIFSRNGIIYELNEDGRIIRLVHEGLREKLQRAIFDTGDKDLDALLEAARTKIWDPTPIVRKEALEKLWDAWERLKTLESMDKKTGIQLLLKKVSSEPQFQNLLDKEGATITDIGNNFMIRHHEATQTPITSDDHVEYLFSRLFDLVYLLLKATNRIH